MANCVICGKPVLIGKVVHTACMEAHAKEELKETICDHYCRFPRECHDDESLAGHCNGCLVEQLLELNGRGT